MTHGREAIIETTMMNTRDKPSAQPRYVVGLMVDAIIAGWRMRNGQADVPRPVGIFA